MGFATGISYFMFIMAFFGLAVGLFVAFQDRVQGTAEGFESTVESLEMKRGMTKMNISAVFNNSGYLFVFVENEGETELVVNKTDIFIDGVMVGRSFIERDLYINDSHDIRNPGLWGPGEELIFNVSSRIPECNSTVKVVNQYGEFANETLLCIPLILEEINETLRIIATSSYWDDEVYNRDFVLGDYNDINSNADENSVIIYTKNDVDEIRLDINNTNSTIYSVKNLTIYLEYVGANIDPDNLFFNATNGIGGQTICQQTFSAAAVEANGLIECEENATVNAMNNLFVNAFIGAQMGGAETATIDFIEVNVTYYRELIES